MIQFGQKKRPNLHERFIPISFSRDSSYVNFGPAFHGILIAHYLKRHTSMFPGLPPSVDFTVAACKRLVELTFTPTRLRDGGAEVKMSFPLEDGTRAFVGVIDEVLDRFDLPLQVRKEISQTFVQDRSHHDGGWWDFVGRHDQTTVQALSQLEPPPSSFLTVGCVLPTAGKQNGKLLMVLSTHCMY